MADEKSAIDSIFKMEKDIENIYKLLSVIDNNIKLLNNKISKISKKDEAPQIIEEVRGPQLKKVDKLVIGNIKVFAKLVNKNKEPLEGVSVTIYNDKNEIIKEKQTDKEGIWDVRLPPGKYGAEYKHKNFKPINKIFLLTNDIKEFEVK